MEITVPILEKFLFEVDHTFPVPLSQKQSLPDFARKLCEKATLCGSFENGRLCSLAAGYTENIVENRAYISVVATLPCARGKGYASKNITEFIAIAREKGLDAVHLYAVRENTAAVKMYEKLGFVEWKQNDEPRPDDLHLIYYIGR